ncbi:MAG: FlgN protein [Firmicutes bacterium]|nr:FlgN protein [Bacillota bacterium]
MKENWEKLIGLLDAMIELYSAIVVLSKEKQQALIEVKPQKIEAITKQEERLILEVGKLEAARSKLMKEIALQCKVETEELSLNKMAALAGPGYAERLMKVAEDLNRILGELGPLNQLNTRLIEQALSYINFNINVLAQSTAINTYAPGQMEKGTEVRKLIDRKV